MHAIQLIWKNTWRSLLVAVGYVVGLMLAGMAGAQMASSTRANSAFTWLFISSILPGAVLGLSPRVSRLRASSTSSELGIDVIDNTKPCKGCP